MIWQMSGFAWQAKDHRFYSDNEGPQWDFKQERCNEIYYWKHEDHSSWCEENIGTEENWSRNKWEKQ